MFSESRAWASGGKATSVRICESGDNYSTNTGNGYYGAWQFDISSWYANGGGQFASQPNYASKDQQDYVAYTYWQRAAGAPGPAPDPTAARPGSPGGNRAEVVFGTRVRVWTSWSGCRRASTCR